MSYDEVKRMLDLILRMSYHFNHAFSFKLAVIKYTSRAFMFLTVVYIRGKEQISVMVSYSNTKLIVLIVQRISTWTLQDGRSKPVAITGRILIHR